MSDEEIRLYDRVLETEEVEVDPDERGLLDKVESTIGMEIKPGVLATEAAGGAAIAYIVTGMVPLLGPILQRVAGKYIAGAGAAGGTIVYLKSNRIRKKDKKEKE